VPETSGSAASPKRTSTVPSAAGRDRHLAVLAQLVEQDVAAVEQVVGRLARAGRLLDGGVEADDLVGGGADRAGRAGDRDVLGRRVGGDGVEAVVELADRGGQRLAVGDERLAGRLALGVLGDVAPRVPELVEQRVDAVVARLVERGLDAAERLGGGLVAAERHRLRAELQVEEVAAQAAVGLDLDALAEQRARAVGERAGREVQRLGGDERGLLAAVADGVGVREVVRGDVEAALLREQAAQRGVQPHEARDLGHARMSRTRWVTTGAGAGVPFGGGPAGGAAGAVGRARAVVGVEQADEVIQERELLAHERAVGLVLALDLGEQPAQLGGALVRGGRLGGGEEQAERVEGDLVCGAA
jgi:hypothetical protein